MKTKVLFAILVMAASTSIAQLTYRYSEWADGPVRHLMTREEMKQWKAVKSDDDAKAFVDLFWARRDPTPDTPINEYRNAFEQRVVVADKEFGTSNARGAMTDRGKVFILLGPPYQISTKGAASTSHSSIGDAAAAPNAVPTDATGGVLLPSARADRAQQYWNYAHDKKPKFVPQTSFTLVFSDEGMNDWQLAHTERVNPDAILIEAATASLVSPNLTKAPFSADAANGKARMTSFSSSTLKSAYQEFRSGDKTAVGPTDLTWGEFVTPEGERYVAVQLYAPGGSGIEPAQKVTFFGVVENAAGEVVEVDEQDTAMVATGRDSYVDRSLRLDPGTYNATFGVASDGKILSARRTTMTVTGLDPAATGISPLILSNNVYPMQTAYGTMDPFTFGGLKVVPKGDAVFVPKGDLWYFVELRNPGMTAEGNPTLQIKIDITGKTAKGPVEMKFPLGPAEVAKLKGEKNRFAIGLAIPLDGFVPGDYTMKIHLVDTVLTKSYDLVRTFKVSGS